jgi:D-alanyl-D-alanine carboxypeptidase (penicillin-binding protein 5/6)
MKINNLFVHNNSKVTRVALVFVLILESTALVFSGALPLGKEIAFASELHTGCKAVYLVDADSGIEMYSHRSDDKLPIASMVKIMTTLLAFEAIERDELSLDDMVEISENASSMGGSQVFLDSGKSYKAGDLIKSIVVASANDSCVAIAERIEGSVDAFVGKMNARAKELGMNNTNFVNCTGLPAPESYSCAKDVAVMYRALISHPVYFDYAGVWLEDFVHHDGRTTSMTNTNKLIRHYNGCDGGKTGFTSEAKFCLSATAKRNGLRVIAVVVGADSSKERFGAVSKLFNYAFANYSSEVLKAKDDCIENSIRVLRGKETTAKVGFQDDVRVLVKSGEKDVYDLRYDLPRHLTAPVKRGGEVGKAYLTRNGEVIGEYPIIALDDIERAKYGDLIKQICKNW